MEIKVENQKAILDYLRVFHYAVKIFKIHTTDFMGYSEFRATD